MHQTHQHTTEKNRNRKLFLTMLLNLVISGVELIGGLLSNSLALISDALHNFSDGIAVLITYFASKASQKAPNQQHTFGYKRIEILSALFNALTLIAISIFLMAEAWKRFQQPEMIEGFTMLWVALIGLAANLAGVLLLHDFSHHNLNVRAAYLHLIGDTLSSVAVIIGGLLVIYYQLYWIDPLITALIGLYIIKETWEVLTQTYHILMQAGPKNIPLQPIADRLMQIEGIRSVHHIHVWQLTDHDIHFEAHIEMDNDMSLSTVQKYLEEARRVLTTTFGFTHITLQPEIGRCNHHELIAKSENCQC